MIGLSEEKRYSHFMTEEPPQIIERPPAGNLTDFVYGYGIDTPLDIDVAVNEKGKVVVFHNLPFKNDIAWYEFDLATNKLDFVLDDGDIRDIGLPLTAGISRYMQNSHQILTVLLDNNTGEAKEGKYIPLIVHRS